MIKREVTYSFIVKDKKQDKSWCKCWDDESSLTQHNASTTEDDARLSSSCNHAFLQSSTCIYEHTWWEHDTCESSLCSNDEHNDSIKSSDHDDLIYISIYQNMQR